MGCRASRASPQKPRSPEAWGGRRPHLVGLDQVEVLPVHSEAVLKVPALLLAPSTEPVCNRGAEASAAPRRGGRRGCARQGGRSPRMTFTLNRSLRRASSTLKLHFTSSYSAWGSESLFPPAHPWAPAVFTPPSGGDIGCSHHHWVGTLGVFTPPPGRDISGAHTTIGWGHHTFTTSPAGDGGRSHHPRRGRRAFTPPPRRGSGRSHPQHLAYLLTVSHRLPHWELQAGYLVPPPRDRAVQELLHLSLREDAGVPEQLVFVLIPCAAGGPGSAGARGPHLARSTQAPPRLCRAGWHSCRGQALMGTSALWPRPTPLRPSRPGR